MHYRNPDDLEMWEAALRKEEKAQRRVVVLLGLFCVAVLWYKLPKLAPPIDIGQWFVPLWIWGTWIYHLLKWHSCHVEIGILRRMRQPTLTGDD